MLSASDDPVRLPAPAPEAPPPPFPLVSVLAPVAGAGVLWLVTGSAYVLWFAALGPVLALAAVADGRRGLRRARKRRAGEQARTLEAATAEVAARHETERRERWDRHPDVAGYLARPDDIWRSVPGRQDHLVVGAGQVASTVRVDGGEGDAAAEALRRGSRTLAGAPVVVPVEIGLAVVGPPRLADAVARGVLLQACLSSPPGEVQAFVVDDWARGLPHGAPGRRVLRFVSRGEPVPADGGSVIVVVEPGAPPPPQCGAVLTLTDPAHGRLLSAGLSADVVTEPVSVPEAIHVCGLLARRAAATPREHPDTTTAYTLAELVPQAPPPAPDAMAAVIGTHRSRAVVVDLVGEGPHAIVIGVTGSGKSELLTTWVTALAMTHRPDQVAFLLVDFKGGTAFRPLAGLPHVTGVISDLDEGSARRAIESLRAEIRQRERILVEEGARDVADVAGRLGRLVIVVDEYAALAASHPDLQGVFADIAARGRALGLHLILSSQRAAGVFRDAVLANAPLRIALRVTDAADSRAVLGVDDAAALSGEPRGRGICLVRGPADTAPRTVRVSLSSDDDRADVAQRGDPPARRPWLTPLPSLVPLADLPHRSGHLLLGLADEPERQRQPPATLAPDEPGLAVLGGAGSGRSAVLRALRRQADAALTIPAEPEEGWDAVEEACAARPGTTVIADDLDVLLARLGPDHGGAARDRLEQLASEARGRGIRVIVSAQRANGAVSRIVDALPRRFLLAHPSRGEFVAAGGNAADHGPLPPGRGLLDGVLVQTAWTDPDPAAPPTEVATWRPTRRVVAFVSPGGPRARALRERWTAEGVSVVELAHADDTARPGTMLWGTPDEWLAQWRLLAHARAEATFVVDATCRAEYRALTGSAELPPYVRPHARRAWLWRPGGSGGPASRVVLPA